MRSGGLDHAGRKLDHVGGSGHATGRRTPDCHGEVWPRRSGLSCDFGRSGEVAARHDTDHGCASPRSRPAASTHESTGTLRPQIEHIDTEAPERHRECERAQLVPAVRWQTDQDLRSRCLAPPPMSQQCGQPPRDRRCWRDAPQRRRSGRRPMPGRGIARGGQDEVVDHRLERPATEEVVEGRVRTAARSYRPAALDQCTEPAVPSIRAIRRWGGAGPATARAPRSAAWRADQPRSISPRIARRRAMAVVVIETIAAGCALRANDAIPPFPRANERDADPAPE